jgi:hypothetical protein
MMLLRILDDRARNDRRLADEIPSSSVNPRDFIQLLGEIYHEAHPRSEAIHDKIFEDARRLAEEFKDDEPEISARFRKGSPLDFAECLSQLMGWKLQTKKFLEAIDGALLTDKPNGLAVRRRVSRSLSGRRRSIDVRSIVLSSSVLDFAVHRHLCRPADNSVPGPLSLPSFLALLRENYGLYVDREPPGQPIPRELLLRNKAWLERRLRDLGLLIGVNDAESMKQLRPRYQGTAGHVD